MALFGRREPQERFEWAGPVAPSGTVWLVAMAGPYLEQGLMPVDAIAPALGKTAAQVARNHERAWGIRDAASARESIEQLLRGLHAPAYDEFRAQGVELSGHPLVVAAGIPLTPDIWGWDLARAANLVRVNHALGRLSEPESIELLTRVGAQARGRYSSWQEYGASFLAGRVFWLMYQQQDLVAGGLQIMRESIAALHGDPRSPWRVVELNPAGTPRT